MEQLQVPDGEAVKPNIMFLLDTAELADMAYLPVLGDVEILQDGPGGDDPQGKVVNAKAF